MGWEDQHITHAHAMEVRLTHLTHEKLMNS